MRSSLPTLLRRTLLLTSSPLLLLALVGAASAAAAESRRPNPAAAAFVERRPHPFRPSRREAGDAIGDRRAAARRFPTRPGGVAVVVAAASVASRAENGGGGDDSPRRRGDRRPQPQPPRRPFGPRDVLIGLDVGTQGTKAVLYRPETSMVVGRSSVSYGLSPNPDDAPPGRAEQDPAVWEEAVIACLRDLAEEHGLSGEGGGSGRGDDDDDDDGGEEKGDDDGDGESWTVRGVGVSGQQHGMVVLDADLRPLRDAKLWCDVEAAAQAETFSRRATAVMEGERVWDVPPGFTAPKVLWMIENEPDLWEKVRWVVLPHDYVNLLLRGAGRGKGEGEGSMPEGQMIPTTDAGDASGTAVLDPRTGEYVPALAECVDPSGRYLSSLPEIIPPNAVAGYLSPALKREVGIDVDDLYDVPLSAGSGDNMCSALGCGCVRPGAAVLSLGTSGTIFGVSDSPVRTGTSIAPFRDAAGRHLPLACVMSCTAVLQFVLENWCSGGGDGDQLTHDEATELAKACPPGCDGLTFLPYLGGERTPNWPRATGALLGLTPANADCMSGGRPGLAYRAALEGLTYLLADALDDMRDACGSGSGSGFRPERLLVVGGGSRNRLWRQMLADVLGMELQFPLEAESAALGAAFQAGAAATGCDVDAFVAALTIEKEEGTVIRPTEDEATLELYRDGRARFQTWSSKLFGGG